jgi:hypothetical protein
MEQHPIDLTLASRLERLERECAELKRQARRWRMMLAGVTVLLVGAAWQPDDGVIKVRGLVIEDEKGKARISLRVSDFGPSMIFTGSSGLPRILMGLGGRPNPSDTPFLNMRDETAAPRVLMGLSDRQGAKGDPYLNIRGDDGKVIFQATTPKAFAPPVLPRQKKQDAEITVRDTSAPLAVASRAS